MSRQEHAMTTGRMLSIPLVATALLGVPPIAAAQDRPFGDKPV